MTRSRFGFLIGLAWTVMVIACQRAGVFEGIEVKTFDARYHWRDAMARGAAVTDHRIALVEITDECLQTIGKWPWPRDKLAALMDRIAAARPRAVGLDIELTEPDRDARADAQLAQALQRVPGLVLAASTHEEDHLVAAPDEWEHVVCLTDPLKPFLDSAHGRLGLVDIDPFVENPDGVYRKVPLAKKVGRSFVPGLALALAATFQGRQPGFDPKGRVTLGEYAVPTSPGVYAKAESGGPKGTIFEQYAYIDFPRFGHAAGVFDVVTAGEILRRKDTIAELADRIVLVGLTAQGLERDKKLTVAGLIPGVELQATVLTDLLDRSMLDRMAPGIVTMTLVLLGIGLALGLTRMALLPGLGLAITVAAAYVGMAHLAYVHRGVLIDCVGAVVLTSGAWVAINLATMALALARRMRSLSALNQYARAFNDTLNLEELMPRVLEAFASHAGSAYAALALMRDDTDTCEITGLGAVPARLDAALRRRKVQTRIIDGLGREPCVLRGEDAAALLAIELVDAADLPQTVIVPAFHRERPQGWVLLAGDAMQVKILSGEEDHFWLTLASMAIAAAQNAILYKLATVDPLTGLFRRHFFDIQIDKELSRATRYGAPLSLLVTDIDHFKKFNDTYGHLVGDRVLRAVAGVVRAAVRSTDVACRYGGEEFSIILPDTDLEGARLLADRVRVAVGDLKVPSPPHELSVTISVGLSCTLVSRARTVKEIVEQADEALYAAKDSGRNRVCIHRPEQPAAVTDAAGPGGVAGAAGG